jgi:hypothetical protein
MHLRDALTIASKHVGDEHLACVVLKPGQVAATNNIAGCVVPCEEVTIDCAVNCAALLRMVKAIGSGPKLELAKGRKVIVTGEAGTASYTLQAIPEARAPVIPDVPAVGWVEITEAQMTGLCELAGLVEAKAYNQALAGIRLTPSWAAVSALGYTVCLWTAGLTPVPFTAPPGAFLGMGGPGKLLVNSDRLWVQESSGQIRWTLGLQADWPDAALQTMVATARAEAGRGSGSVDVAALAALAKQAAAIAETKLDRYDLVLESGNLSLIGGDPSASYGAATFSGSIPCAIAGSKRIGVSVPELEKVASAAALIPGGSMAISVGGPRSPILIWGGDAVIIEGLVLPVA